MLIVIQVLYFIICIAEAWLEQAVIYLKNEKMTNYAIWNAKEHRRSLVYAIASGGSLIILALLYGDFKTAIFLIPLLIFIRRIGFDFALKVIRGRRVSTIEGDQPIDNFVRWILGKNGGWWDLLISAAIIALFNYL